MPERVKERVRGRLDGIDAARGTAMLFVCLSHFGLEYFRLMGDPPARVLSYTVGRIASPTFMLISGITLGMLYHMRRDGFDRLRLLLADRGLFMLTIGHALIVLSTLPREGSLSASIKLGFITDVVGVAVLVGPFLVRNVGPVIRSVLAVWLYVMSLILTLSWQPDPGVWSGVRYLLVGMFPDAGPNNFPLLPWLAIYLLGTVIGERAARAEHRASGGAERLIRYAGLAVVGLAVAAKGMSWYALPSGAGSLTVGTAIYDVFSPWQKLPPTPMYVAWFGGCGMLLVSTILWLVRHGRASWFIRAAAVLGRASLFVFILQFYVYYGAFHLMALPYTPMWPAYLLGSIVLIWLAAWWWDTCRLQRYLTVGIPALRAMRGLRALRTSLRISTRVR